MFWNDHDRSLFRSKGAERQSRFIRELISVDAKSPRKEERVGGVQVREGRLHTPEG